MKIIVDSKYNMQYCSFYLQGLFELFGWENIRFDHKPFVLLKNSGYNFNFIIHTNLNEIKYTIDFNDFNIVDLDSYCWTDVYGKVNANFAITSIKDYPKLISMAPGFGIQMTHWVGYSICILLSIFNFDSFIDFKKTFGRVKNQFFSRCPLKIYESINNIKKNYIFHLSTLWNSNNENNNNENVNLNRYNFIITCKSIDNIVFDGGLINKYNNITKEVKFINATCNEEISHLEYVNKTKKSIIVFNTPAYCNCHGWKLGEYLAMGKAIISTPLSNDLPYPLEHGKNIYFIKNNSKNEIKKALLFILDNPNYRKQLELGAKVYWSTYCTPIKSLHLLGLGKYIK